MNKIDGQNVSCADAITLYGNNETPYLRGILDLCVDMNPKSVTVIKLATIGRSMNINDNVYEFCPDRAVKKLSEILS